MLGYEASAERDQATEPVPQPGEMVEVRWFSIEQVREAARLSDGHGVSGGSGRRTAAARRGFDCADADRCLGSTRGKASRFLTTRRFDVDSTLERNVSHTTGGSVADEPLFETKGIDYIPLAERRGTPLDLAWMWAGALFNVEYVVYGALLIVAFGLGSGRRWWWSWSATCPTSSPASARCRGPVPVRQHSRSTARLSAPGEPS